MKVKQSWWSIDPLVGSVALLIAGIGMAAINSGELKEPPLKGTTSVTPKEHPKAPADFVPQGPEGPITVERKTSSSPNANTVKTPVAPVPGPEPIAEEAPATMVQTSPLPFGSKGEKACLKFLSGTFVPPTSERIQPDFLAFARAKGSSDSVFGLIMLDTRIDDGIRSALTSNGVSVLGYYPETGVLAKMPCASLEQVSRLDHVRWIGQPNNKQKLDPTIYNWVASGATDVREVYVSFFTADADGSVRNSLTNLGATLGTYDARLAVVYAKASATAIQRMMDMDAVFFVEPVIVNHVMHSESQMEVSSDYTWGAYDGTGGTVRVGVMDTGVNIFHNDFSNIFGGSAGNDWIGEPAYPNWWNDGHGHGTHVTGTFIGEGNYDFTKRGVAQGIHNTGALHDYVMSKVFNSAGNSVGTSVFDGLNTMAGAYGSGARQVYNYSGGGGGAGQVGTDTNSRKVDDLFVAGIVGCIAAGNNGGGAQTVTQPGVAKGAFTAANIRDDGFGTADQIAYDSGRGTTGDSRIKPDFAAPGHYIDSTSNTSNTGYRYGWWGTSMASPHAAGIATSIVQHYGMPAWATKAVMLATGIQIPGLGTTEIGRGKLDARLCNYTVDSGGWNTWWNTIGATGSLHYWDISIPYLSRLKVVLTWPDPAATAGAGVARVNDIDLGVQSGALNTTWSYTWGSTTGLDTVEVVTVDAVPAGTYRIKVYNYAGAAQSYAVTAKYYVYSPDSAGTNCSISGPVAVQPNSNFTLNGTATALNNIGSGTVSRLELLTGGEALNGSTVWRRAPSGSWENYYWAGNYDVVNGDIEYAVPRYCDWSVYCTSEGVKSFRMRTRSSNGGEQTATTNVIVDGTPPTNWGSPLPSTWTFDTTPDCSIQVQDVLSGLDTSRLYYWYWNGGWVGPFACSTTAANGSTSLERISADGVPFPAAGVNYVWFRAFDRAGNQGDSGSVAFYTDNIAPANWSNFTPSGWQYDNTPNCTVQVQDTMSGLNPSFAYYRYSTNGGSTWSAWNLTSCTGVNGSTALETISANNVPFNQYSGSQNYIQFAVLDQFQYGYSGTYNVLTGAIVEHSGQSFGPGSPVSGTDANLLVSDDGRWNFRPGAILVATQDPIVITLSAVAPPVAPQNIWVTVESKATVSGIRQIVEAWNYNTSSWTNLETFVGLPFGGSADRVITLAVPNPAQHVGGGSAMQVRLRYKNTTAVLVYPWNIGIDRLYWTYHPN